MFLSLTFPLLLIGGQMMSGKMKIRREVTVKAKLTENLQKKLVKDYQDIANKLDGEIQALEQKMKDLLGEVGKSNPAQAVVIRQQLTLQKEDIQKNKDSVLNRAREISAMELGSEVFQGTVEGIAEIRVGDNLEEVLKAEIVVEDGKILEFR